MEHIQQGSQFLVNFGSLRFVSIGMQSMLASTAFDLLFVQKEIKRLFKTSNGWYQRVGSYWFSPKTIRFFPFVNKLGSQGLYAAPKKSRKSSTSSGNCNKNASNEIISRHFRSPRFFANTYKEKRVTKIAFFLCITLAKQYCR